MMCGRSCSSMPIPWSSTDTSTPSRGSSAADAAPQVRLTVIAPPAGLYLMALLSRLSRTRTRRAPSQCPDNVWVERVKPDLVSIRQALVTVNCFAHERHQIQGCEVERERRSLL